jgi:proline dehydrogenase
MLLVARSFKRQARASRVGVNPFYSQPESSYRTLFRRSAARPSRILCISAAGGGTLTATLLLCWGYPLYADVPSHLKEPTGTPTPLSKLFTSYVVYSACSIPGLVEASPVLLASCASIPGLRQLTEAFIRATFFKQVLFRLHVDEIG